MDTLKNISNVAQTNINNVLRNPYVMAVLKIALVLYAAQIAPRVPGPIQSLFQNTIFKIVIISLIAYLAEVDFQLAIMMAVVFVLSANILSGRGPFESFMNEGTYYQDKTKYTDLLGHPAKISDYKLIESNSDNFPGCDSITLADLLNIFDGDHVKLQQTVTYAFNELLQKLPKDSTAMNRLTEIARAVGLPYNVELNDSNAKYISTILINQGFKVTDSCQAPH